MLHSGSSVLENVPQLVQEVSFLFDSTVETREYITATLQVRMLVWCVCALTARGDRLSLYPLL